MYLDNDLGFRNEMNGLNHDFNVTQTLFRYRMFSDPDRAVGQSKKFRLLNVSCLYVVLHVLDVGLPFKKVFFLFIFTIMLHAALT
jgi:hypothetical protein